MSSLYFITAIFTIFCMLTSRIVHACDGKTNEKMFHKCLNQWSMFKEKRSATSFLKDDYLIDEICLEKAPFTSVDKSKFKNGLFHFRNPGVKGLLKMCFRKLLSYPQKTQSSYLFSGGVSLEDMDDCMRQNVDPSCDHIFIYWQSTRDKYTFICKWRKEFFNHYRCRTNVLFASDVDDCNSRCQKTVAAGADYCQSMRILRKCLFRALDRYCSVDAKDFFRVVFDLELAPLMKYTGCHEDFYTPTPVSSIDSPKEKKDTTVHGSYHDRGISRRNGHGREISASVNEGYQSELFAYISSAINNISHGGLLAAAVAFVLVLYALEG